MYKFRPRLKRFASFVSRTPGLYREYGARAFVSEFQNRVRRFLQRRYSYRTLLEKYPEKFKPSQGASLETRIDSSACTVLGELFRQLDVPIDARHVLLLYRESFGRGRYCQLLEDLFRVEQFTASCSDDTVFPLVQASGLPPLTEAPVRRRILFITSQFPSPYHGGGNRVLNFIKFLSQNNDIYLASAYLARDDNELFPVVAPYCYSIFKIAPWKFGGNQAEIRAWLDGNPMDVVHYEWPRSLENYDPGFGRIQIFTYMEAVSLRLLLDIRREEPFSDTWLRKFAELTAALRLELADSAPLNARIAVTTKDADFFRGLNPRQEYTVLNHGLTFDEFVLPEVEPEPQTLVFVGNYLHYPNMDAMNYFFDEVWGTIRREVPRVRIYVVGTNPPEKLRAMADGEHIVVTGSVPDVRPYIQKATVCIAPLISGAGLRGKVIEYAALRRTFVGTSIAATDLAFEDGRDFMRADTAADFAGKVVTLLENPGLAAQMGSAACETARHNYDTRRLVDFLNRLYARLERS